MKAHQEAQQATISSSFMPNFNLHGPNNGGASAPPPPAPPTISTSFHMNFPPTNFKVQNEEEDDDYDT
jgi:hypothetical protein